MENVVNVTDSVINILVSNDRSELGKKFGVGLIVSEDDTPEKVIEKCNRYISRYTEYIENLRKVIDSGETLASEMKKAKVTNLFKTLTNSEREALKAML